MLENLEILNGSINQNFDSSIYEYEVSVDSDVLTLLFNYKISNNSQITIYGNDELTFGENHVYIEILYEGKVTTYTFLVTKPEIKTISTSTVESSKNNFLMQIKTPLIGISCFILIITTFCIIFHKK